MTLHECNPTCGSPCIVKILVSTGKVSFSAISHCCFTIVLIHLLPWVHSVSYILRLLIIITPMLKDDIAVRIGLSDRLGVFLDELDSFIVRIVPS